MNEDALLPMKILIVDDEPVNVALLEDLLQISGFEQLRSTTDPRRVQALCREFRPDLILLDLNMPYLDGFGVLAQLGEEVTAADCLPILVLTADINLDTKRRALAAGATDFLTKPFDHVEVILRISNLLRVRHQHLQLTDQKQLLESAVRERTAELSQTLDQLRNAQGQIIQQERLSALGSMTAGIAHDFNNVLSLILGYSEMLLRSLQQPGGAKAADMLLGTIITAAQDAAKMFARLREFHRPADKGQPKHPTDINQLVEQAIDLTHPRWHSQAMGQGATIRVVTDLHPDLPPLMGEAAELREMLTNLIFNAVDAMPKGGTITLRTRLDGSNIVLEIGDTGTGMTEETRSRCLEPFFTTKGQKGTGLGLAMVYGIVQRHGGTIELLSELGKGTRFVFSFPPGVEEVPAAAVETLDAQRPLNILAVDDQPVLCEILAEYLSDTLHTVETACDGNEALEKFRAGAFDLVITDKAMPEMSGDQLAAHIKALSPRTRVILLTGYGGMNDEMELPANIDMVVDKPVTREGLRQAVSRVTAQQAAQDCWVRGAAPNASAGMPAGIGSAA
jgi:signal transduction histidine kinase